MLSEIQYMKKGEVYRIKNRQNDLYLTGGEQITCSPKMVGKIAQYWLADEVKPTQYEIVSLQSGEVLTRNQKLSIQKGRWYANQFWSLCRAQINKQGNYFWVIASDNDQKYLFGSAMNNKVAVKSLDKTLFVSNWKFQRIDDTEELAGCCVFRSKFSEFVIDVPEGSHKDGVPIIQYTYNGRGNQRWVLENLKQEFIIRNICSNMILCPQNKDLKNGTKIIQSQFTNHPSEKWVIIKSSESTQDDSYHLLCNSGDSKLLLSVSSNKESANLILSSQKQKSLWKLSGNLPQILQAKIQMIRFDQEQN